MPEGLDDLSGSNFFISFLSFSGFFEDLMSFRSRKGKKKEKGKIPY